ncbi:MAG: preprotein translocase subunit SecG [Gammaproteobacteria bacterium]|nr:preprotein translocase subunit SecG [Gammaproteobacteria bacterium]
MYTAMVILDVILASALIGLILLQQGKGADAGAAFGSGSSGTVFGASGGASIMQKITTWIAVGFFAVTLGLSVMAKDRISEAVQQAKPTSVVQDVVPAEPETESSPVGFVPETATPLEGVDAIPESAESAVQLPSIPAPGEESGSSDSPVIPE